MIRKFLFVLLLVLFLCPKVYAANTGAKVCGTVESTGSWTNCTTTRLNTSNNSRATWDDTSYSSFQLSDFAFGIPTDATIDGISVNVEFNSSWGTPGLASVKCALSYDNGVSWTADSAVQTVDTMADITRTYGGATDTWGRAWDDGEFVVGTFQLKIYGKTNFGYGEDCGIDYVTVTVYYTEAPPPSNATILQNCTINNAIIQ